MKASVPGASNKLGEWVSEWLSEYVIFLHGLAQQWGCKRNKIWHKGSVADEDDAWTSNTRIVQRKHAISHSTMKMCRNMTSVLVTALCNQPEAFASDLGDDQSRYLCSKDHHYWCCVWWADAGAAEEEAAYISSEWSQCTPRATAIDIAVLDIKPVDSVDQLTSCRYDLLERIFDYLDRLDQFAGLSCVENNMPHSAQCSCVHSVHRFILSVLFKRFYLLDTNFFRVH